MRCRHGFTTERIYELSAIDPWFLENIRQIVEEEAQIAEQRRRSISARRKKFGFSDRQLAFLTETTEPEIRAARKAAGVLPTYRLVDTCAAEFEAYTPYYYSTYGDEDETRASDKKKVMILGGGPNRIGQGIEFDYCCVHAAFALKELGWETIMVNSNPETVSTDYDTSDKLYFEPLTLEDVLNIYERERGGCDHRAVRRADSAEPRRRPRRPRLQDHRHPANQHRDGRGSQTFRRHARQAGPAPDPGAAPPPTKSKPSPWLPKSAIPFSCVLPSCLGGRAMQIVHTEEELHHYMRTAVEASPERPVLVDRFLEDADRGRRGLSSPTAKPA